MKIPRANVSKEIIEKSLGSNFYETIPWINPLEKKPKKNPGRNPLELMETSLGKIPRENYLWEPPRKVR